MNLFLEKLFGITLKSDKRDEQKQSELKSFIPPTKRDGAVTIDPQAFGAYFYSTPYQTRRIANEFELITKYRQMSMHPIIDKAIEEVCNEAIVSDQSGSYKLDINLDNIKELSEDIKAKIKDEHDNILRLINYSTQAYSLFRQFYIDGRLFNLILTNEDERTKGIQDVRLFDPRQIQLVRNVKRDLTFDSTQYEGNSAAVRFIDEVEEYYVYNPYGIYAATIASPTEATVQGLRIEPTSVSYITSGLLDSENTMVLSFLEKASIVLNQLTDLESAMVIYRLSRSSEKRIFYIDVGKMAHTKASQYVKQIAEKYKTKLVYDPSTGKVSGKNNLLSLTEDYFIPRREGSSATEISTLPAGAALDNLPDLEYFSKLLLKSLNVPQSRFESAGGFSLGKTSEITRDEIAFRKFITRLQNKFGEFILQLLRVQLELKGIMSADDFDHIAQDIKLDFQTDNFFYEMKESEILSIRAATANELSGVNEVHQIFSSKWIKQNIFKLTEEQIKENDIQIALERKQRLESGIENPEDENKTPASPGGGATSDISPNDLTPEPEAIKPEDVKPETDTSTLESFASLINQLDISNKKSSETENLSKEAEQIVDDIIGYIQSK